MQTAGREDEAEGMVHVIRSGKDRLQSDGPLGAHGVSIVSYDLATKLSDRLSQIRFGVCVCDESHTLKSPNAARTQKLLPLATAAKRVIFLSGTPVLSRPIEIYTQASALRPAIFGKQKDFSVRYCAGHQGRFGWDEKGASNCEALCAVLTHSCMIRREKAAVLTQLPDKLRCRLSVDIPQKERQAIAAKMERVKRDTEGSDGPQNNPLVTELYQQTGLAKVSGVMAHVETLLSTEVETKALLFGHHHGVLDGLAAGLDKSKATYVRIDGRSTMEARAIAVKRFQSEPNVRVALLSISAAGVGLTLTAAQVVVFAECSWDIGGLKQAEDRAHRIGQKNAVLVQYCLADGTLDDWMWRTIERKLEVTSSTVNGQTSSAAAHSAAHFAASTDGSVQAAYRAGAAAAGSGNGCSGGHGGGEGSSGGRSVGVGVPAARGDIRAFMSQPGRPLPGPPRLGLHDALARGHEQSANPGGGHVRRERAERPEPDARADEHEREGDEAAAAAAKRAKKASVVIDLLEESIDSE